MSDNGREDIEARRSRAVKTALLLGLVAAMIFVAFVLSGVIGR